jgi:hypothetical protein
MQKCRSSYRAVPKLFAVLARSDLAHQKLTCECLLSIRSGNWRHSNHHHDLVKRARSRSSQEISDHSLEDHARRGTLSSGKITNHLRSDSQLKFTASVNCVSSGPIRCPSSPGNRAGKTNISTAGVPIEQPQSMGYATVAGLPWNSRQIRPRAVICQTGSLDYSAASTRVRVPKSRCRLADPVAGTRLFRSSVKI